MIDMCMVRDICNAQGIFGKSTIEVNQLLQRRVELARRAKALFPNLVSGSMGRVLVPGFITEVS